MNTPCPCPNFIHLTALGDKVNQEVRDAQRALDITARTRRLVKAVLYTGRAEVRWPRPGSTATVTIKASQFSHLDGEAMAQQVYHTCRDAATWAQPK